MYSGLTFDGLSETTKPHLEKIRSTDVAGKVKYDLATVHLFSDFVNVDFAIVYTLAIEHSCSNRSLVK